MVQKRADRKTILEEISIWLKYQLCSRNLDRVDVPFFELEEDIYPVGDSIE